MLGLAACGGTDPTPGIDAAVVDAGSDAGAVDAGFDAGPSDADVSDAAVSDADVSDASAGDADVGDAAVSDADVSDASAGDADVGDAAVSDADVGDASAGDADVSDAAVSDASAGDAGVDAFVCMLPPTAADWAAQGTPCASDADCPSALRCQFQSPSATDSYCEVFCVPGVCDDCGSGYVCFPTTGPDGDVNSCLAL
jgi:hypothetical protein